jgi:aminoglycoside 3-N-acetyltransferase
LVIGYQSIGDLVMKEVTKAQLIEALQAVGVQPGDGLLVHSALQFLGRPVGGVEMYFEALREAVGHYEHSKEISGGTLAVPTYTFVFARGEAYDPQNTPSVGMGQLSELIRRHPAARRTTHPMQSLAVIGKYAEELARCDTPSAFDPGSAYDEMIKLGFKILLVGADIDAVSLIHYSEQRLNVPYRYWKDFSGPVKTAAGWQERTYRMYVRDIALDPHLTLHPVRDELRAQGLWSEVALNYGKIALIAMQPFVAMVDRFLSADPYALMLNRPDNL